MRDSAQQRISGTKPTPSGGGAPQSGSPRSLMVNTLRSGASFTSFRCAPAILWMHLPARIECCEWQGKPSAVGQAPACRCYLSITKENSDITKRKDEEGRREPALQVLVSRTSLLFGVVLFCCLGFFSVSVMGQETVPQRTEIKKIDITDPLPYGQSPVDYYANPTDDRVAKLQAELTAGKAALTFDKQFGYLPALLKLLNVSRNSQMLVYSQTALNQRIVRPDNPRAVYFNDEVSIGFVPGAANLEIMALDPLRGPVFYLLPQQEIERESEVVEKTSPLTFTRERRCLACHAGRSAMSVPGYLVRSYLTNAEGKPTAGYSVVTHDMDFEKRFGGWYVTGKCESEHQGNLPNLKKEYPTGSAFETKDYLTSHSDLVAQLLFHHQQQGQNLITRVRMEHELGRRSDAEAQLLRYLFFVDEPALPASVTGSTDFARQFQAKGKTNKAGKSLREFELKTRLFRYRLSYLVQTRQFIELPAAIKSRLYPEMQRVLSGTHPEKAFGHLEETERRMILEILTETHPDFSE